MASVEQVRKDTQKQRKYLRIKVSEESLDDYTDELYQGAYLIGSHETCEIQLPSEGISRRHALILVGPTHCSIIDLLSTNGTLLNGNPVIRQTELPEDGIIKIGKAEIMFRKIK